MARKWRGLVIHHSAGPATQTVEEIRRYHKSKGWSDIGYHFLVARDREGRGHLKRGRPDTKSGAHAGDLVVNATHLGLCVIGNFGPHGERMRDTLYQDVLAAVVHVMRLYGIPASGLKGHCEVKATSCPGEWFPLERLKRDVAEALG